MKTSATPTPVLVSPDPIAVPAQPGTAAVESTPASSAPSTTTSSYETVEGSGTSPGQGNGLEPKKTLGVATQSVSTPRQGNAATRVAPTDGPPRRRAAAEVRQIFRDHAFPAVRDALQAGGLTIDGHTCNVASTALVHALERLGVGEARVVEGTKHIYVEVQTSDGQTLILDPTMAQFFRDGSPAQQEALAHGFVGTANELKRHIERNVEDWQFDPGLFTPIDPQVLAASRGKPVPDISLRDGRTAMQPYLDNAYLTHFEKMDSGVLMEGVRRQDAWFRAGDLEAALPSALGGGDKGPTMRAVYAALVARLGPG